MGKFVKATAQTLYQEKRSMQISKIFIPSRVFFLLLASADIHLAENLWTCLLNIPF